MRTTALIVTALALVTLGCATGTAASDDSMGNGSGKDAGAFSSHDSGSNNNNNNNNNNPQSDAGGSQTNDDAGGSMNTCMGTMCGSQCVDTTSDDSNCGTCGNACPSGATCTSSSCVCDGGETLCSSACVDTTSDNSNCGKCGKTCTSAQTCTAGKCVATSNAPPQGSCSHSLCSSGSALDEGCDTDGCTIIICDPYYLDDEFCCSSSWDATCEDEVTTYCSPYSCS